MAGGGKVRIADRDDFGELARVVNGRLLVSGTGGGVGSDVNIDAVGGIPVTTTVPVSGTVNVGNFPATQPVSGTVTVNQGTSPWVVSGTVNVGNFPATVAVTQSTSPWVVSGTVAVSSITNPVTVQQSNINNLKASVQVLSPDGSNVMSVLHTADTVTADIDGIPIISETVDVDGGGYPVVPGGAGSYSHSYVDTNGRLLVRAAVPEGVGVVGVQPGTGNTFLGKAEDQAFVSTDVGVMALAVRADTPAATAANGDYVPLLTDSLGRLHVNIAMEKTTTINLSGSTHGRPIQIAATATPGTTLHTATTTTGLIDKIFLWLTNTSSSPVKVTIEYGTTGAAANAVVTVPANETVQVLDGTCIGGNATTDTVAAFAATTNVINAFGRVERLTNP